MSHPLTFVDYLRLVQEGIDVWKNKPHNAKWWKRIDGTPIPNDIGVCIAEVLAAQPAAPTGREALAKLIDDSEPSYSKGGGGVEPFKLYSKASILRQFDEGRRAALGTSEGLAQTKRPSP